MAGPSNWSGLSQGMTHHVLQNGLSQNKLYVVMTDNAQGSVDKTIGPIQASSDIILRKNMNGQSDMCFTTCANKATSLTPNTGAVVLTRLTPPFTPDLNPSIQDSTSAMVITPDIVYMTPVNNVYNPKMGPLTSASDEPYIPVSDSQGTTLKTRDCIKRDLTGICDADLQASVPRNSSFNVHVLSNSLLLQAPVKQRKPSCQVFTDVKDKGITRFFNNYSSTALEDSINDFDHLFTKPTSATYSSENGSRNNGHLRPVMTEMEGPPRMEMDDMGSASLTQPPLRCSLVFSSPPAASTQGAKFVMATPENLHPVASISVASMGIDAYKTPTNVDLTKNPVVRKILISEPIPMNDKGNIHAVKPTANPQGTSLQSVGAKADNSGNGKKPSGKQRTDIKASSRNKKATLTYSSHHTNFPETGDKQTKASQGMYFCLQFYAMNRCVLSFIVQFSINNFIFKILLYILIYRYLKCTLYYFAGNLNDSLTNIQWLGGINFEDQLPKNKLDLTDNEVERVSVFH